MNLTTILLLAMTGSQAGQDELSPARAMELLEDAKRQMRMAEERLNDASPEQAETHERGAAEKLAEIIKKAGSSGGKNQQARRRENRRAGKSDRSSNPARQNRHPKRVEEPSRFKSTGESRAWGNLPPAVRRALRDASREDVPPEFQELWKRYCESFQDR